MQNGGPGATTGLALTNYQATYSTFVNSQCSKQCASGGFIFFGTVNQGTTGAECW